jgi:hypothetical protein
MSSLSKVVEDEVQISLDSEWLSKWTNLLRLYAPVWYIPAQTIQALDGEDKLLEWVEEKADIKPLTVFDYAKTNWEIAPSNRGCRYCDSHDAVPVLCLPRQLLWSRSIAVLHQVHSGVPAGLFATHALRG